MYELFLRYSYAFIDEKDHIYSLHEKGYGGRRFIDDRPVLDENGQVCIYTTYAYRELFSLCFTSSVYIYICMYTFIRTYLLTYLQVVEERNRRINGIYEDPEYETMMLIDEEVGRWSISIHIHI